MHKIFIELTDAQCQKLSKQKGRLDVNAYATKLVLKGINSGLVKRNATLKKLETKLKKEKK